MACKHESTITTIGQSGTRERCLVCGKIRARPFWGASLWIVAFLLTACSPGLPEEIRIEKGFSLAQEAAIRDAAEQWCDATAGQWCPQIMGAGSVGAAPIRPLLSAEYEATANPHSWSVNRGEKKILVDIDEMNAHPDFAWQVFAHELGHFAIEGHTPTGLMAAQPTTPVYCIDSAAAARFCRDAVMKGCVSTC